jgi:hypothetical protein
VDVPPLTPVEQKLVEHVERGDILDLAGDDPVDEKAMRAWDDTRTISATAIRDIVRGRLATNPDPHGLRLRGARIRGRVDLENISSTLAVDLRDCLLDQGMTVRHATLSILRLAGCRISHATEPPLDATRLTAGTVVLSGSTVDAKSPEGGVRLVGARIGGTLSCTGTRLHNDSGPALYADQLTVGQSTFLRNGFTAIGAGDVGAIHLGQAHVGGVLDCSAAVLRNDSGPAIRAQGLRVDQVVFLRGGFAATGSGEWGTVRLINAQVGRLDCSGAVLRNDSGPALYADHLKVDKHALLRDGFEAVGGGNHVALNLSGVVIGGALEFSPQRLEHRTDPQSRLGVDGLVYAGLPGGMSTEDWLTLLRDGTPKYAAQPYQHLATALRAAGHDREARRVLMAQRRDQIQKRALTGRAERGWARLTGVLLGYGYQPWRALIGLFAVILTAVVLSVVLGAHGALAQTPLTSTECTVVQRIGVGLDLGTPLITTGARARCDATNSATGQALAIAGWGLRLLAWAFATLFIAGFTGAVRKT